MARELLATGVNIEVLPFHHLAHFLMQDWPEMEDILALSFSSRVPPAELAGTASAFMPASAPRTVVSYAEKLTQGSEGNVYLGSDGRTLLPQRRLKSGHTMVPTTVYRCPRGVCSEDIIRALKETPSPAVHSSHFAYAANARTPERETLGEPHFFNDWRRHYFLDRVIIVLIYRGVSKVRGDLPCVGCVRLRSHVRFHLRARLLERACVHVAALAQQRRG